MFKFGERSLSVLSTVDEKLQEVLKEAIKRTPVDFGIPTTGGLRTAEEQNALYKDGKSKADGYKKLSNHQSGKAIDVFAYVDGQASWATYHLRLVALAVLSIASEKGIKIRWGGTFGERGRSELDGWDKPHFELID